MDKINFQNGTKLSDAKVTIDDVDYVVTPAQYSGTTSVNATNLNQLQTNVENEINSIKTALPTLDGRIVTLQGTLSSRNTVSSKSISIPYPTGFNATNCAVISQVLYEQGYGDYDIYYNDVPNSNILQVGLSSYSSNISILGKNLDTSGNYTYKYRIVLFRFE